MQGSSGISIREGWYLRHRPGLEVEIWGHLKMGIEAKRGNHPERKGKEILRAGTGLTRPQFLGGVCEDLSGETAPSLVSREYKRGAKSSSTTCQETPVGKAAWGGGAGGGSGRAYAPWLPSPGGKCYLHVTTHSHGPFSHPSPSSAICVEAVVFLSDPSYWNSGRKRGRKPRCHRGAGVGRGVVFTLGGVSEEAAWGHRKTIDASASRLLLTSAVLYLFCASASASHGNTHTHFTLFSRQCNKITNELPFLWSSLITAPGLHSFRRQN